MNATRPIHRTLSAIRATTPLVALVTLGALTLAAIPAAAASAAPATTPTPVVSPALAALAGTHVGTPARITTSPAPTGTATPRGRAVTNTAYSSNWGGYVASATAGAFASATATYVVPTATCPAQGLSGAAFWVGLDGWTSPTVEQDGVDELCVNGTLYYEPWFEMYPASSNQYIMFDTNTHDVMSVNPGDTVTSIVGYTGGVYTLSLVDSTNGQTGIVTAHVTGIGSGFGVSFDSPYSPKPLSPEAAQYFAQTNQPGSVNTEALPAPPPTRGDAECIAEDPGLPEWPYASYSSVTFSSCTANGHPMSASAPFPVNTTATGGVNAYTSPLGANSGFTVTQGTPPPPPPPTPTPPAPLAGPVSSMAPTPTGQGYWLTNGAGNVSAHGDAKIYGSLDGTQLNASITHIVATPSGHGYWLVARDGGIFSFGDAGFYGSMGSSHLNAPVVDLAPTSTGKGYWLVASDGGIFAFGDAAFHGSMGATPLAQPVVGITSDPATGGYWEVAQDGGIFAFNAPFAGSMGATHLNRPVVAIAATSDGGGYWMVASDGGIFNFGDAGFHGSMGGTPLAEPVVGLAADPTTDGYWEVARDGGIFSFGAPFYGAD